MESLNTNSKKGFHPEGSRESLKSFARGIYFSYFRRLNRQGCICYISSIKVLIYLKIIC